jgi:hypothetical protein
VQSRQAITAFELTAMEWLRVLDVSGKELARRAMQAGAASLSDDKTDLSLSI